MLKFYFALYFSKCIQLMLKLLRRNATYLPGKIAITICPDFLAKIKKPKTIIGVTGTNGKTTVCNLVIDLLEDNGYKVLNNKFGSNVNSGMASSFISGVTWTQKVKNEIAVLEIDERSSLKVYPYVKPNYLLCTNLFRDSIRRNAHPEYISSIINKQLPKETTLILNADDLISSSLGTTENKKVYFGINKLDTDLEESINIINDMRICPKCNTKLKYNYVRYHHIGNAYCPNCDFKSPEADYKVENINYNENKITVKHNETQVDYNMLSSSSIFNIYNMIAVITLLQEFGISSNKIQESFEKINIVGSRYQKENINGVNIVYNMAKGQNPIACSCVFDYVKKEEGKKEIILMLDDVFDAKKSSENLTWIYDCDFEFLNSDDIEKIIIGGVRSKDYYLRLLIAGVPEEKLVCTQNELDTVKYLSLEKDKTIYILFELYADPTARKIKENIKKLLTEEGGNI